MVLIGAKDVNKEGMYTNIKSISKISRDIKRSDEWLGRNNNLTTWRFINHAVMKKYVLEFLLDLLK